MKKLSSVLTALATSALFLAACGHTTSVSDTHSERDKTTDVENSKPATKPAEKGAKRADAQPSTARKAETVPVASAPSQLLEEGALKDLQRKLQTAGMLSQGNEHVTGRWDAPTEQALRRFQRENDLPATGMPDRASADALGLDPDELFKRAETAD